MAHPFPLQAGDVAPDFSERDASLGAEQRADATGPVGSYQGVNAADQLSSGKSPLFRAGQMAPVRHTPPYATVDSNDLSEPDVVHEVDILRYGDAYDPTAPMRVRQADNWTLDSDNDGHLN